MLNKSTLWYSDVYWPSSPANQIYIFVFDSVNFASCHTIQAFTEVYTLLQPDQACWNNYCLQYMCDCGLSSTQMSNKYIELVY